MIQVSRITHGPHKGRFSWRIDVQPAYVLPKNAATPRQYQRHGIALNEARARTTAARQLLVHQAANDNRIMLQVFAL